MAEHPQQGHGLLAAFHDGCRCAWCAARCREANCPCATCTQWRATSPYVELPTGQPDRGDKPDKRRSPK